MGILVIFEQRNGKCNEIKPTPPRLVSYSPDGLKLVLWPRRTLNFWSSCSSSECWDYRCVPPCLPYGALDKYSTNWAVATAQTVSERSSFSRTRDIREAVFWCTEGEPVRPGKWSGKGSDLKEHLGVWSLVIQNWLVSLRKQGLRWWEWETAIERRWPAHTGSHWE